MCLCMYVCMLCEKEIEIGLPLRESQRQPHSQKKKKKSRVCVKMIDSFFFSPQVHYAFFFFF